MAYILFSSCPFPGLSLQELLPGKIRLSIFLITGVCAGLPALVWALRALYRHRRSGNRVSAFVFMLLLCDLLVLLLNPYIVQKLLWNDGCWESSTTCRVMCSFWSGSIICGLHLQQVVALEGTLSSRHPLCSAHAFIPSCSIFYSIVEYDFFLLCELFSSTVYVFMVLPLFVFITLTSWIVTWRTPPQISESPYRTRRPSFTVLAFVTLTLILYGTFSSTCVIMYINKKFSWNLLVMCASLMSLNVIIDPLLCVIIYRKTTELSQSEMKHLAPATGQS